MKHSTPGVLLLADRGFYDFYLWQQAAATGADLLWRVTTNLRPRYVETLSDGSWLARIIATSGLNRTPTELLIVRVIAYTIDDGAREPRELAAPKHNPRALCSKCCGPRRRLLGTMGD